MDNENSYKGRKYLSILFVIMFVIQLIDIFISIGFEDLKNYIPKCSVIITLLIAWFYSISQGYSLSKWLFVIACFLGGVDFALLGYHAFKSAEFFYNGVNVIENIFLGKVFGVFLFISGSTKLSCMLFLIFNPTINKYFRWQKEKRYELTKREIIGNSFSGIGYTVIACFVLWFFVASLVNTIYNPKLIVGFFLYTPLKLPLYAIPGFLIVMLGEFIIKGRQ